MIVMDITMPGMSGLEATKCLRAICPESRVLILTVHEKKEFIREMIQSGAQGYIRKNTSPDEFVSAIERIHRGETFFMPDVAQAFFNDYVLSGGKLEDSYPKRLSDRERQVLSSIVEGLANKDIGHRLHISIRTVEKHRQRIMKKLGIHKATELVKFAITRGFVNLDLEGGSAAVLNGEANYGGKAELVLPEPRLKPESIPFVPPMPMPERRTL